MLLYKIAVRETPARLFFMLGWQSLLHVSDFTLGFNHSASLTFVL